MNAFRDRRLGAAHRAALLERTRSLIPNVEETGMPATISLDGLGELAGARVERLLDGTRPGPAFRLEWGDGDFCACHVNGRWLHFDMLVSQNGQHRLVQLVSCLPNYFRRRGITHFSTTASGANDAMLSVGFEWHGNLLLHDISEGCRMDQYAAWRRGEAGEPVWHKELTFQPSSSQPYPKVS